MTAESLISTPNAIVLASDGNITISSKKSFSGAEKIKKLSDKPPMVMMYYGNADFGSLDLDSAIDEFIENSDFNKLNNIKSISKEFIHFLEENSYSDDVKNFIEFHLENFKSDIENQIRNMDKSQFFNFINSLEKEDVHSFLLNRNISFFDIIPSFVDDANEINNNFLKVFSNFLTNSGTGIVIAGFDKEYNRPSYIHVNLIVNNEGTIEYKCLDFIENYGGVAIVSFAQNEDINTFLYGIHPEFEISIISYWQKQLNNCFDDFYDFLVKSDNFSENVLREIEIHKEIFKNDLQYYELKFINHLDMWENQSYFSQLNILPLLPKRYLVTFARFLILLVSSKKRYSLDLESVGGDIKTCLITKVKFEWITFEEGNF